MASIGEYIRQKRLDLGMSQSELADAAEVSRAYMSQIESGGTKLPGADLRRRLAKALGVSHLELLIAAGELLPEEVTSAGMVATPPEEDERTAEFVAMVRQIDWSEQTWYESERATLRMFTEQQKRKGKR